MTSSPQPAKKQATLFRFMAVSAKKGDVEAATDDRKRLIADVATDDHEPVSAATLKSVDECDEPSPKRVKEDTESVVTKATSAPSIHPLFAKRTQTTQQKQVVVTPVLTSTASTAAASHVDSKETANMDTEEDKTEREDAEDAAKNALKLVDSSELTTMWKKGDPVPYSALCKTFEDIEATTKRCGVFTRYPFFQIELLNLYCAG
ncbi:hypothetical protein BC830DRAFT_694911 [Chytriomyces sp. MP71]|nr:hypothetical protein BC830DRAFT_694911 [Chytriomyces sp. MP71]